MNLEAGSRPGVFAQPHPLIMVEDANSLLLPKQSFSSILIDSQKSSLERAANENATFLLSSQNNSQNSASLCPSNHSASKSGGFKPNNSR